MGTCTVRTDCLSKYMAKNVEIVQFFDDKTTQSLQTGTSCVSSMESKVFNDPIHGHIEMHPLCLKIIDTPEFQRLRGIKQLGLLSLVYPSATHTRFEHSLGVCHLAGELLRSIMRRQPELGIDSKDILCVEIAGLCHDLGHGPFSHLFDGSFIPKIANGGRKWKHEQSSLKMFEHIMEEHKMIPDFQAHNLDENDVTFIKEQLYTSDTTVRQGRPQKKHFLYEIVANNTTGIDVDKWDYFARDSYMLGLCNNFDHIRCLNVQRVLEVDGRHQLCYRDKEVGNMYQMFYTRDRLHKIGYQHKTKLIVETMLLEAMLKANDHIFVEGKEGHQRRMSDTIDDMVAYSKMTDDVFFMILYSEGPELEASRKILNDILCRNLYKCIGHTQLTHDHVIKQDDVKREIITLLSDNIEDQSPKEEDIIVEIVKLNYGKKNENPIDSLWFYSKDNYELPIQIGKEEESNVLPSIFAEQRLVIICKLTEPNSLRLVYTAFCAWCQSHKRPLPKGFEVDLSTGNVCENGHADYHE